LVLNTQPWDVQHLPHAGVNAVVLMPVTSFLAIKDALQRLSGCLKTDVSYKSITVCSPHLQHLQHAAIHALEAAEVEDGIITRHQVKELLCMLVNAVLQAVKLHSKPRKSKDGIHWRH
jgi:pullulanase/glycogen debranching enzyme